MCGRFTTTINLEEIIRYFQIDTVTGDYSPLYNAAPTQNVPVALGKNPRRLVFLRWGLVPHWAKDISIGSKLINARAETLLEKPSFRDSFKKKRCIIVADGFYEWQKLGNKKIPHRIIMKDKRPFALAGLWAKWTSPQGTPLFTCTIITTQANSLLQSLHHRMPVILNPADTAAWLDPTQQNPEQIKNLLNPYPAEDMEYYPVSSAVNSPSNTSPDLIKKS